jgi:transitional endoplasmic reticulum ATPase
MKSDIIIPRWLKEFDIAVNSRERCIGFTFNYSDYVLINEKPVIFDHFLKTRFKEQNFDLVFEFSLSEGLNFFDVDDQSKAIGQFERYSGIVIRHARNNPDERLDPLRILKGIDKLLHQGVIRCGIIIKYAEHLVPNSPASGGLNQNEQVIVEELINSWASDPVIATNYNILCMLVREGHICDSVREKIRMIRVDLPELEERKQFCDLIVTRGNENEFSKLDESLSVDDVTRLTSGLSLKGIERLFRRGTVSKSKKLTRSMVVEAKKEEIRKLCGELIEVFDTEIGFESIAGMNYIKRYFSKLKLQLECGNGGDLVRAILMVGVPGSGKSFSVRALANKLGFNCVVLRNIRSMWVGESEKNLDRGFNATEALSPTIMFTDEIDQALGQRGMQGDSGVSQRMLARIWEFMAREDLRGKVLFIAASNRPDLLDPATVDRFGVVVPFLLPTISEMEAIIPVLAKQLCLSLDKSVDIRQIASILVQKKISPRQTLDVLSMSRILADDSTLKSGIIDQKSLLEAAMSFQSNADSLEIERITLEAIRMTTFKQLLPWYGSNMNYDLPAYTENIIDQDSGDVDISKLNERLNQIKRLLYLRN